MSKIKQDEIVNHLKNYGFVFANSEIYGGLANAWDYGPLGTLLKQNIKNLWWKEFITKDANAVGLDSSILMNPTVWKASGHLGNFSDPLIDCKKCKSRFRADKLIENVDPNANINESTSFEVIKKMIVEKNVKCPECGSIDWTDIRKFNLMFKTFQGVLENESNTIYLRPETAQGIFVNYANIQRSMRLKLPFAVGQIGKAFRNEITPGNFIFRIREFEQMELEYFCKEEQSEAIFDEQLAKIKVFLTEKLNLKKENLFFKEHDKEQLSHYSSKTIDVEYEFPHGRSELWGIANRTNFDINAHALASGANLWYLDPVTNEKIVPHVIEPSVGVERLMYALCCDVYRVETLAENDERIVMGFPFNLSPYKIAILPLTNKLVNESKIIYENIIEQGFNAVFDISGSIGKRYRRQDAIGTPFCATYDFQTLEDNSVTIRNRDTMKQERIAISDIKSFLENAK